MRSAACTALAFLALSVVCLAQARPQRPVMLFNGKDLSGWSGAPGHWSVVDGVITGTTEDHGDLKLEQNTFLVCEARPADDFELALMARVSGDNNSGIQYRSRVIDAEKSIVSGYQLDIHPRPDLTGMVYEERGRGILAKVGTHVLIKPDEIEVLGKTPANPAVDITEWNEYSITTRGNRLIHRVNGNVTATAVDTDPDKRSLIGVIALQLHAGPAMKLEVKDVVLRRLNRAPLVSGPKSPTTATPTRAAKWITNPEPGAPTYFRYAWKLEETIASGSLKIAADAPFIAYLNGKEIGSGATPGQVEAIDISTTLTRGYNTIAVRVDGGELAAHLTVTAADGITSAVVSSSAWIAQSSATEPAGWKNTTPDSRRDWRGCVELRNARTLFEDTPEKAKPPREFIAPGFELTRVLDHITPFTALTSGPDNSLFIADADGQLFQITALDAAAKLEIIDLPVPTASGMVWAFGSLYVVANHPEKSGLYRLDDTDSDGQLDSVELLKHFGGSGKYGPHGIAIGPSPQTLYVIGGRGTRLPRNIARSRPPAVWGQDHLLPTTQTKPPILPGGWICQTRTGGKEWELHSIGHLNARDLAFSPGGQLITTESASPFFRGASIYHVPRGADLGLRGGDKNFPIAYPDTIPPITELDHGTPSGLAFGTGAKFPARYQRALFTGDPTRNSIDAHFLTPTGSSFTAASELFITAPNLHVTDIAIADNGAMFFTTAGEISPSALWRVTYTGAEDATRLTPQPPPPHIVQFRTLLDKLGKLQGIKDPRAVTTAWPHLDNRDRLIRHAARTAIEHHPPQLWLETFQQETRTDAVLEAAIALARTGQPEYQPTLIDKLAELDFRFLSSEQKIAYLRAHGLAFIRLSPPTAPQTKRLRDLLSGHFPSKSPPLDIELARMLIYLGEPTATETSLILMISSKAPRTAAVYASFLLHANRGWTPEGKANYLDRLENAPPEPYLQRIRADFLNKDSSKTNE